MDFSSLPLAARFAGWPPMVGYTKARGTGGCASYLQVGCQGTTVMLVYNVRLPMICVHKIGSEYQINISTLKR